MTIIDTALPSGFQLLREAHDALRVLQSVMLDARGQTVSTIADAIERYDPNQREFNDYLGELTTQINNIDYYFNH